MPDFYHIDNEGLAGWSNFTPSGLSTVEQTAAAAFPERGGRGLRVTIVGTDVAYAQRITTWTIAQGESAYVSFWFKLNQLPPDLMGVMHMLPGLGAAGLYVCPDGELMLYVQLTSGNKYPRIGHYIHTNQMQWEHIAVELRRSTGGGATDGGIAVWLNGALAVADFKYDNDDRFTGTLKVNVGVPYAPRDGMILDYDEVQLGLGRLRPEIMRQAGFGDMAMITRLPSVAGFGRMAVPVRAIAVWA